MLRNVKMSFIKYNIKRENGTITKLKVPVGSELIKYLSRDLFLYFSQKNSSIDEKLFTQMERLEEKNLVMAYDIYYNILKNISGIDYKEIADLEIESFNDDGSITIYVEL